MECVGVACRRHRLPMLELSGLSSLPSAMTTEILKSVNPSLYEEDYYLWIETTLQQLQNKHIALLMWVVR
ncbi:hypothetical protein NIES4074_33090 [Cylindrospermum sp. NIES-4074]|nr:hypothetical protein NIES4074_33090 [Cylindrospermum sp. NIES-4074]